MLLQGVLIGSALESGEQRMMNFTLARPNVLDQGTASNVNSHIADACLTLLQLPLVGMQ